MVTTESQTSWNDFSSCLKRAIVVSPSLNMVLMSQKGAHFVLTLPKNCLVFSWGEPSFCTVLPSRSHWSWTIVGKMVVGWCWQVLSQSRVAPSADESKGLQCERDLVTTLTKNRMCNIVSW